MLLVLSWHYKTFTIISVVLKCEMKPKNSVCVQVAVGYLGMSFGAGTLSWLNVETLERAPIPLFGRLVRCSALPMGALCETTVCSCVQIYVSFFIGPWSDASFLCVYCDVL